MKKLSKSQEKAVTLEGDNVLCLAGPGSGKTEVLARRIGYEIGTGADPKRIVAITFTVEAGREIQRRVNNNLGVTPEMPSLRCALGYVGTLHGWALRLIQETPMTGYGPGVTVIDEEESKSLLKEQASRMKYRGSLESLLTIKRGPESKKTDLPHLVVAGYYRDLRLSNCIDFDRILSAALATTLKAKGYVGIDCLFVDEYQDSGSIDAMIYSAIFAKKFFVGDPDQAIYGFRGGSIESIITASESPVWKTVLLEENYRSVIEICLGANRLIRRNLKRVDKKTISMRGKPGILEVDLFHTQGDECRSIVQDLLDRQNFNDSAILCRTNALANGFAATLQSMGLQTKSKNEAMPDDWKHSKNVLLFCLKPSDDRLAGNVLESTYEREDIDGFKLEATAQHESLNQNLASLRVKRCSTPDEVMAFLRSSRSAFIMPGIESLALIEKLLGQHPGLEISDISSALIELSTQSREEGTGVTVTTIHGAKGREWGTVYLPCWNQEVFPGKKTGDELEEERRLAYVAITRAKDRLLISSTKTIANPYTNRQMDCRPNIFIQELGK
jgi:DNA helicase-2/ATP-dependent DNA helicase PcrA